MGKKITWLHLSDLHYGQKKQNILLPKIKKEFFKDIEYLKNELGKIDVVFFSGDLTQSGSKEEFNELTAFLKDLWGHFRTLGCDPYLIAIPGNHDLSRPDSTKAVVKVLKNYQNDEELKDSFWAGIKARNENYDCISQCFNNFDEWYKQVDLPKPELKFGLIPGDVSTCIDINGVQLKIVGLNTAFLELSNGDHVGKLVVSPEQVIALTSSSPLDWIESADIAIFMTHHDPRWYDQNSLGFYENDINPASTFYSHLCGHLHEPITSESRLVGSDYRKIQVAPSLFGLSKIGDDMERIHGYYAGTYTIVDNTVLERFYPRIAFRRYDHSYSIVADNGFNLRNGNFLEIVNPLKKSVSENIEPIIVTPSAAQDTLANENILDLKLTANNTSELAKIPKVSYQPLPQHINIRLVEQRDFLKVIQEQHYAWLVTDWGLNEAGFLGSIAEKLQLDKMKSGFILNCEDLINESELIAAFEEQFSMTLQRFCNLAGGLKNSLLVLDHVNANLYSNINAYHRFLEIINSIVDFCPNLYVVIIARQAPSYDSSETSIRLFPLDGSDVKTYISHHQGNVHDLESSGNLFKLVEITSGLPKHIDRIIDSLKVATFEELLEAEREISVDVDVEEIPKSLKQAIGSLTETTDRMKLRSFKLLKILTVLSNGEIFSNLKKIDGAEPIYIDNANELEQLSLLEIITTSKALSKVARNSTPQIKLLRVPRQTRDYVNTLITESERDTIARLACEMYFGRTWRSGKVKDIYSSSTLLGESKFLNVDNCHLIINILMINAVNSENAQELERIAYLAINFCHQIYNHGDYKNTISISENIYDWLKPTPLSRLKATNAKLYGRALRMLGARDRSTQIFKEALEIEGGVFSNEEKNSIYAELGYTYVLEGDVEKALECAKAIEKTAPAKGLRSLQAKYIYAQAVLTGDELLKKLRMLELEARRNKQQNMANTISLKISELETNSEDKEKRFSKILESKGDDYNRVRAIIKKSLDSIVRGGSISEEDLYFLNITYTYLYTQRLEALFKDCHTALWTYCVQNNRTQDLLNLFKHSSLIWRLSGKTLLEREYFEKLKQAVADKLQSIERNPINEANIEYYTRRKLEFDTAVA